MKSIFFFFFIMSVFFVGCAQQDENKFKEKAQIEENAKNKAEQDATNARARKMEADLERRHRFYQSLSGAYTGTFTTASGVTLATKLKMIPSLPPYVPTDRIRTIEEISADINNLYFNIQIIHWSPNNPASATGCVFQEVRGDFEKGRVDMARAECSNVYSARIIDIASEPYQTPDDLEANSTALAQQILAGKISAVNNFKIIMQPTNNAGEYTLDLARVGQ
ncbi:MAG: hypothetical protein A2Z20_11295 [Bdellovibrionales bacterium RBG_16_40_8]|nr:MAG: hypothetical protein A2Z20_11295 [Bdellovibrionales bacterium RBG_16_40_8]